MTEDNFKNNKVDLGKGIVPLNSELDRIAPNPEEIERLAWLSEFERKWYPVRELKPWHKLKLKEYTAKKQKQEGHTIICEQCGKTCGFDGTQIHHPDHDRGNNVLSNIRVYCNDCNEDEKRKWLSQLNSRTDVVRATLPTLKRENGSPSASEKLEKKLFSEAPTTFRKSKQYKQRALEYLIEYFTDNEQAKFDELASDIEALTGCSHAKAEEYLNGYSLSKLAFLFQYEHPPDSGTMLVAKRKNWDGDKYATDEYKAALKATQERKFKNSTQTLGSGIGAAPSKAAEGGK